MNIFASTCDPRCLCTWVPWLRAKSAICVVRAYVSTRPRTSSISRSNLYSSKRSLLVYWCKQSFTAKERAHRHGGSQAGT